MFRSTTCYNDIITFDLVYTILDIFLFFFLDLRSYSPYRLSLFGLPLLRLYFYFLNEFRISSVLKTSFSLIATRFPFLYFIRTRKSSLASVSSFYKRAFLEIVLSRADPDRLIYYFIGVSRVEQ